MKKPELDLAVSLVNQLTDKFKPEEFKDTFSDEIKQIIEQKAKGLDITAELAKLEAPADSDLLETLRASLEKAK